MQDSGSMARQNLEQLGPKLARESSDYGILGMNTPLTDCTTDQDTPVTVYPKNLAQQVMIGNEHGCSLHGLTFSFFWIMFGARVCKPNQTPINLYKMALSGLVARNAHFVEWV